MYPDRRASNPGTDWDLEPGARADSPVSVLLIAPLTAWTAVEMPSILIAQSSLALLLSTGAPCRPSTASSRVSVRMNAPMSEAAAKAAWLAKRDGKVVPTAPAAAADMTCAWATDNYSAGQKATHIARQYATSGADHAFHNGWAMDTADAEQAYRPPPEQPSHTAPEMTCGWATDNYSAGQKATHIARQYAAAGEDHAFHNGW